MYYRCKDFVAKDASGAEVNIEPIGDNNPESEIIVYVNELRGTLIIYPNISVSGGSSKKVTVNKTPVYIISGGSLEVTGGQIYDSDWITFTGKSYPEGDV